MYRFLLVFVVVCSFSAPAWTQTTATAPAKPSKTIVIDFPTAAPKALPVSMRVEMGCLGGRGEGLCQANTLAKQIVKLPGDPDRRYTFTLRVRGVVETSVYQGGKGDNHWYVGGLIRDQDWNIFELDTTASATRYYLNAGWNAWNQVLDYTRTLKLPGGTTLTLQATDMDGVQSTNSRGLVVASLGEKEPFKGQYMQVDVVKMK